MPPDPALGFDGGVADNAPINNLFWPENVYLVPKVRLDPTGTALLPAFDPATTPAVGFAESLDEGATVTEAGRIVRWSWNDFELEATASTSGWIRVPQLHDRCWRGTVDGVPTTIEPIQHGVGMVIPVDGRDASHHAGVSALRAVTVRPGDGTHVRLHSSCPRDRLASRAASAAGFFRPSVD